MNQDIKDPRTIGVEGLRGVNETNEVPVLSVRQLMLARNQANRETAPVEYLGNELEGIGLGSSTYDSAASSMQQIEEIENIRGEEQPWYSKLVNGVLKGAVTAGTTFLDGTIGLLYGLHSSIVNGINAEDGNGLQAFGEALFNNELSKELRLITSDMEEILPNYRTQDEIENPYALRNIFSMNTIADDFLKNLGFTVGAFYSGNAFLRALRATKLAGIMSSTAAKTIGSVISGVNEGRIEAGHTYDDMVKAEKENLKKQYKPLRDKIEAEPDITIIDPESGESISSKKLKLQQLDNNFRNAEANIRNRAAKAGIADLIMNTLYLPLNDAYMYGKLYARGFKPKADLAGRVGKKGIDRAAAQEAIQESLGKRIKKEGKEFITSPVTRKKAALKGLGIGVTEGIEEGNQAFFSAFSANEFAPDSPDAYYKALTNSDYQMESKDTMTALADGWKDSWGGSDVWKEVGIGFLTGIIGMPTFGKVNNSDHNTYLGRGKTIGLSGGLFGEMSNSSYLNKEAEKAVNDMNKFIKKVDDEDNFFIRSKAFTDDMDGWLEAEDKFEYTNSSDNDLFNAVDIFGRTGRLDYLRDLVSENFDNMSDEGILKLAEDTSGENNDWLIVDGTTMSPDEIRKKLDEKKKDILNSIDLYENSLEEVRAIGNGVLDDDQNRELAWLKFKVNKFKDRFKSIKEDNKFEISALNGAVKTFLNGRGRGMIDEDSEEGKTIVNNMEVLSNFLDLLEEAESPLQVASLMKQAEKGKLLDFFENLGFDIIEDMSGLDGQSFRDLMTNLRDTIRIADSTKSFNDRLKEFTDNPIKLKENRSKIDRETETEEKQKVESTLHERFDWNAPTSTIADTIEANMNEIGKMGGFKAFYDSLNNQQKAKVKAAQRLRKSIDGLRTLVEDSELSDMQKGILSQLIDENSANLDNINELLGALNEAVDNGEVRSRVEKALGKAEDIVDAGLEDAIENTETKINQFLAENYDTLINAINEADKAANATEEVSNTNLERALNDLEEKNPANKPAPKEPTGPAGSNAPVEPTAPGDRVPQGPTQPEGEVPREYEPSKIMPTDGVPLDIGGETDIHTIDTESANDKVDSDISRGNSDPKYHQRPQLTQYYMHGYDLISYLDYLKSHKDSYPVGVDKEAFNRYIEKTHEYLEREGAFNYIEGTDENNRLREGQEIIFTVDEQLNKDAGTFIVVMKTKEGQVVGTLPSELELGSRTNWPVYNNSGEIIGRKPDDKTLAEKRPEVAELVKEVKKRYEEWEKGSPKQDSASSSASKASINQDKFGPNITDYSYEDQDELPTFYGVIPSTGERMRVEIDERNNRYDIYVDRALPGEVDYKYGKGTSYNLMLDGSKEEYDRVLGELQLPEEFLREIPKFHELNRNDVRNNTNTKDTYLEENWGIKYGHNASNYKQQPFVGATSKVSQLMGGTMPLSTHNKSVAAISRDEVPIIGIVDENGNISRFRGTKMNDPLNPHTPENAIRGQVYFMIPTNKGTYLPALCSGKKLKELSDNDWYIQQIVSLIKTLPSTQADKSANEMKLYRLLNIKNPDVERGSMLSVTYKDDKIYFNIPNPKDPEHPLRPSVTVVNGQISDNDAISAIRSIIRAYPETTISVDINRLGNNDADIEYRKNIASYLITNIVEGRPHSINDWFLYEPTDIEKRVINKEILDKADTEEAIKKKGASPKGTIKATNPADLVNVVRLEESASLKAALLGGDESKDTMREMGIALTVLSEDKNEGTSISSNRKNALSSLRRRRGKPLATDVTEDSPTTLGEISRDIQTIKKMFPALGDAERVILVKGLIDTVNEKGDPIKAYGLFKDGILYISDQSPKGTAFHEAFHYISDMLLSEKEKKNMFEAAAQKYGNLPEIELEEKLAEDFRDFMNGYDALGNSSIRNFFRKLKHFVKSLVGRTTYLDNLFFDIYTNKYKNRKEFGIGSSMTKSLEVNRVEMDEIKARAIADGTFMKAPNGKPTNLTERQWLQVRTKAFKDWFGDWEKVARSSKYRKSTNIPNSLTSATYLGVSVSDAKFDPDMAPDGGTRIIFLGNKAIGEIPVFETNDRISMGGSIGAATEIDEEFRGKGYGKKAHLALANIAKAEGKTLYSDSSNSDAEDALWKSLVKEGIAEIVKEKPKSGYWNHTTYKIINDNLPEADEIKFGDENVSKVVDENGEPLVVYRGVRDDSEVYRTGTFRSEVKFTTNKKVGASRYGTPIALFVNMKNPAIIDYHGEEYDKRIEDEFYVPGNGFEALDRKTKKAVELGYDGLITKNVKDGTNYPIDDYSFLDMNQTKSATDNIGTFDSGNPSTTEDDFASRLLEYKARKLAYNNLDAETKEYLEMKKVTQEDYDNLSTEAKETTLQCMI